MDWTIKSVSISNLLGRHNIYWELSPNVNILGGPNGSGKSTILRAIHTTLAEKSGLSEDIACRFDYININFNNGNTESLNRSYNPNSKDIKKEEDKSQKMKDWEGKDFKMIKIRYQDLDIPARPDNFRVIYINSADQIASNAAAFIQESSLQDKNSLTYLDLLIEAELNKYNQLFTQHTQKAFQSPEGLRATALFQLQERFDKFAISLQQFMPDYKIADMSSLKFERNDEENGFEHPFGFTSLSTGEKQLVYLLLAVTNTLEAPTLLLLDEADLGMHIDWKKILLRELRAINPNMQIIAATHSPSLIEGWYDNVREISQLYTF